MNIKEKFGRIVEITEAYDDWQDVVIGRAVEILDELEEIADRDGDLTEDQAAQYDAATVIVFAAAGDVDADDKKAVISTAWEMSK